ncbi:hypothetical protein TNCV_1464781 [Trichonephila clavipes]|nr:hypothetical protein TNCV_1464781 [Trichonephila clavipes]
MVENDTGVLARSSPNFHTTPTGEQYLTWKEIEEIGYQSNCIYDSTSEGNSENVVLPDEVDAFVEKEDEGV